MTLTQCYRSLNAPLLLVALTAAAVGLAPNHAACAADGPAVHPAGSPPASQ